MSRGSPSRAGLALGVLALVAASPSAAGEPAETAWLVCFARDHGSNQKWVSAVRRATAEQARDSDRNSWFDYVATRLSPVGPVSGGCSIEPSEEDARWRRAVFADADPLRLTRIVEAADWAPDFTAAAQTPTPILDTPAAMEADARIDGVPVIIPASASLEGIEPQAPELRITAKPAAAESIAMSAAEADFQRKLADYELKLAKQQRQVEAYRKATADVARTSAKQRLAAERAAEDYARRMQAHREMLRKHQLEMARYDAELAAAKPAGRHASNATRATRVK